MEKTQSKIKCNSITIRFTHDEIIVLNSLANEAGTSLTGYANQVLKSHISDKTGEMLVKLSPIIEIITRTIDDRMKKTENRLAGLLVKVLIAALEAKGIALNILRRVLILLKLTDEDINKTMTIIKDSVYKNAIVKISNKQDEGGNHD